MLDLIFDPWIVLTGGSVGGILIARQIDRCRGIGKKPETIHVDSEQVSDTFACGMWEIRKFEAKMVEAGIMDETEMSVCDNKDCTNCADTYNAISYEKKKKSIQARMDTAQKQYDTNQERSRRLREEIEKGRYRVLEGVTVRLPDGVPDRAHASLIKTNDPINKYIGWTWTDTMTGKQMHMKSVFPFRVEAEWDEIRSDQYLKAIGHIKYDEAVEKWEKVIDPVTQEHLGDYRIVGDKVETRSPKGISRRTATTALPSKVKLTRRMNPGYS